MPKIPAVVKFSRFSGIEMPILSLKALRINSVDVLKNIDFKDLIDG